MLLYDTLHKSNTERSIATVYICNVIGFLLVHFVDN